MRTKPYCARYFITVPRFLGVSDGKRRCSRRKNTGRSRLSARSPLSKKFTKRLEQRVNRSMIYLLTPIRFFFPGAISRQTARFPIPARGYGRNMDVRESLYSAHFWVLKEREKTGKRECSHSGIPANITKLGLEEIGGLFYFALLKVGHLTKGFFFIIIFCQTFVGPFVCRLRVARTTVLEPRTSRAPIFDH